MVHLVNAPATDVNEKGIAVWQAGPSTEAISSIIVKS